MSIEPYYDDEVFGKMIACLPLVTPKSGLDETQRMMSGARARIAQLEEQVASLRHLHSVEANERFARTPPVSGVVLTQAIVATANAMDRCIACGALDENGTAHGVGDSAAKAMEARR